MKLIGFKFLVLSIGILFMTSCEKDTNSNSLIGIWSFYEACNLNLSIGCIKAKNRDFSETLEFTDNKFTRYYDDSIVSCMTYAIDKEWLIFGDSYKMAQKYFLRNDTLTLIDTCFACYRTTFIRANNR